MPDLRQLSKTEFAACDKRAESPFREFGLIRAPGEPRNTRTDKRDQGPALCSLLQAGRHRRNERNTIGHDAKRRLYIMNEMARLCWSVNKIAL